MLTGTIKIEKYIGIENAQSGRESSHYRLTLLLAMWSYYNQVQSECIFLNWIHIYELQYNL